jgi:hypothetical protein
MSTSDPLAALRANLAAGKTPNVAAPPGTKPAPAPQTEVTYASVVHEAAHQRARYFENLSEHLFAHIKELGARLSRTGTAVPPMPHFEPLKTEYGDFDPNSR